MFNSEEHGAVTGLTAMQSDKTRASLSAIQYPENFSREFHSEDVINLEPLPLSCSCSGPEDPWRPQATSLGVSLCGLDSVRLFLLCCAPVQAPKAPWQPQAQQAPAMAASQRFPSVSGGTSSPWGGTSSPSYGGSSGSPSIERRTSFDMPELKGQLYQPYNSGKLQPTEDEAGSCVSDGKVTPLALLPSPPLPLSPSSALRIPKWQPCSHVPCVGSFGTRILIEAGLHPWSSVASFRCGVLPVWHTWGAAGRNGDGHGRHKPALQLVAEPAGVWGSHGPEGAAAGGRQR